MLYLDPQYQITDSSASGVAMNNAYLMLTGPVMSWQLTDSRSRSDVAQYRATQAVISDHWYTVSLLKQYLNGNDKSEHRSAADEFKWLGVNRDRVEQLFSEAHTIDTICETLRTLAPTQIDTGHSEGEEKGLS
ncbi:hypothetical protein [Mycobacterium gastri]|uniref:hypothetical protein n=1 Tax=Mycobacterium gastri TaxID=1777 RepID=UPI00111C200B|nr:hypothetical protein [Mycobacterium gastri]